MPIRNKRSGNSFLIKCEKDLTDSWSTGFFSLIILFEFVCTESCTSELENLPNSIFNKKNDNFSQELGLHSSIVYRI